MVSQAILWDLVLEGDQVNMPKPWVFSGCFQRRNRPPRSLPQTTGRTLKVKAKSTKLRRGNVCSSKVPGHTNLYCLAIDLGPKSKVKSAHSKWNIAQWSYSSSRKIDWSEWRRSKDRSWEILIFCSMKKLWGPSNQQQKQVQHTCDFDSDWNSQQSYVEDFVHTWKLPNLWQNLLTEGKFEETPGNTRKSSWTRFLEWRNGGGKRLW